MVAHPAIDAPDRLVLAAPVLAPVATGAGLVGLASGGPWLLLAGGGLLLLAALCAVLLRRAELLKRHWLASRQDFSDLIDFPMHTPFLCDADGRMTEIGERWVIWSGQSLDEAYAGRWIDTIHPDDRERVGAAWMKALESQGDYREEYRVRFADGQYRWIRCRAFPNRDREGAVRSWTGILEDDHANKTRQEQLQHTAMLLEMIGSSTESIIWAKDREGRMLYINRALERLAGVTLSDVLGKTDAEWNPQPEEADTFQQADRRVLDSGLPDDTEEVFTGRGGTTRKYRSIRSPLRDRSGHVIGVVGIATDITEQREAEQRERLLTRELDHRAKNLLAVVQSVVTLTRAATVGEFKEAVEGRIQALGRAHSMLAASRWEGADLSRIVADELSPYDNGRPGRIRLEGPPLILRPAAAQSLALVIHELATNAVKYGCLSDEQGQLDVGWNVGETPSGASGLQLRWTERGGPPVPPRSAASRNGFGTRLIHSSIERQLGGSLSLDWLPEGLAARLEVPLERTPASPGPEPKAGVAQAA